MAGSKPSVRLVAKAKAGDRKIEIAAGWPSEKIPGAHNMKLSTIGKGGPQITGVVTSEGEVIDLAGYWLNLTVESEAGPRRQGGYRGAEQPAHTVPETCKHGADPFMCEACAVF